MGENEVTEAVLLLSIVIGAALYGGGIVTGVWLSQVVTGGFPRLRLFEPKVKVVDGPPPMPVPSPMPPPPMNPPPARESRPIVEKTPFRYGAQTELESAENFEKLQQRLRVQEQFGPYADSYTAGSM